jgi:hypothetical protein
VKRKPDPVTPSANASRLSGIPRIPHDEDERPSREDLSHGQTIFTRPPVPLPRWLVGGKRKQRSQP